MKTWPNTDLPILTDDERWEFLEDKIKKEGSVKLSLDDLAPEEFPQGYKMDNYCGDSLRMTIDFAIGNS